MRPLLLLPRVSTRGQPYLPMFRFWTLDLFCVYLYLSTFESILQGFFNLSWKDVHRIKNDMEKNFINVHYKCSHDLQLSQVTFSLVIN